MPDYLKNPDDIFVRIDQLKRDHQRRLRRVDQATWAGQIAIIIFVLALVFWPWLRAHGADSDTATGHASTTVCGFRDQDDNYYSDPAKCPGLCCVDCGGGCVVTAVPERSLPGAPPVQSITIIDAQP